MMQELQFFVCGIPRPAGSKRALHRNGKTVVFDMSGKPGKLWRRDVARLAIKAARENTQEMLLGPVGLTVTFSLPRPKAHYDAKGLLRRDAPKAHVIRPDATKLLRAVEDALTGVLWADDAQIIEQQVSKVYAAPQWAGASIRVRRLIR